MAPLPAGLKPDSARLVRASEHLVTSWAGGETRQLAIAPADSSVTARDFDWRFSTATVLQSGPFTFFDGYQRYLAIRTGAGFELTVTNTGAPAQQIELKSRQHQVCFAGTASTAATLLDGPVRDINLMLSKALQGGIRALQLLALRPSTCTAVSGAWWLIYADGLSVDQQIRIENQRQHWVLSAGDLLILPEACFTCIASSDCSAVAAWIAPVA